jgi:hypothetical protein
MGLIRKTPDLYIEIERNRCGERAVILLMMISASPAVGGGLLVRGLVGRK